MTEPIGNHSWKQVSVQQLRDHLVNKCGYTREQVEEIKGKKALIQVVETLNITPAEVTYYENPAFNNVVNVFDEIKEDTSSENVEDDNKDSPDLPSYTSYEWHDFVMSHFHKDELQNGYPTCDGLRRVAGLLLGDIVTSEAVVVFPSLDSNAPGRSTVQYRVEFLWKLDGSYMSRVFGGVADVWDLNSKGDVYTVHTAATAETRAEARALKKALRLRVISAEEDMDQNALERLNEYRKSNDMHKQQVSEWKGEEKVTQQQEDFIVERCERLGIDLTAFINKKFSLGESEVPSFNSLKEVPRSVASSMIQELVKYQSNIVDGTDIPEQLKKGYKSE